MTDKLNGVELPSIPPGVKLVMLENGLTIIVREDHSAPVVSAQAWCETGSINEGRWLGAGLSHVLEHMLFKGTATRPGSRIDQEVQEAGGYMNAYTSFDRTVYYINVPNTGARTAIDILCDIMQNASLPADELAKELDVIRREMDMNEDDPGRHASRRLFEVAYTKSPYRYTIIGYPQIFNQLAPADIMGYYKERYVPNNICFIVVGDIKAAEAIAQIKQAFAGSRSRPLPPLVLPPEPRQTAPREIIEEAPIELGHFHFGWHIPGIRHPDLPALDILAALLGSGRSSRLFREVREKQGLVTYVDAWTYNPGELGMFGMSAVVDPPNFSKAGAAMLAEVERIKAEPVAEAELNKVIKQFTAGLLSTRKTMQGQAQDFGGSWFAASDLNFSARYLAAIKRVTPADLQRVAHEYLTVINRTHYALLPEGLAPTIAETAEVHTDHAIQKFDLPNGLRLLIKEDHRLPFVELRAVFEGGVLAETPANNGLSQLMSKMLLQGTRRRSAEQIAVEMESVGGSIESFGGNNSFGVNAEVLSSDLEAGLDLFADVLLEPSFPAAEFEREREIQLQVIRDQRDRLLHSCTSAMRNALFGPSGYGLDSVGEEETVQKLQPSDAVEFYRRLTRPDHCVLAIFGDVQTAEIKAAVEKTFANWKPGGPLLTHRPAAPVLKSIQRVAGERDKKQAVLVLGFPGVAVNDPDRFTLELIQEACSDLGSRLFLRIRDKLGLAYYVGAQNFLGLAPGYFAFYVGTAPEKVGLVEEELRKEIQLLRADGLDEAELRRAKAKVIGQKKIARQDLGSLALTVALDELYGLGYDYFDLEDVKYEAVTLDQVRAAAQKHFNPEAFVLSTIVPIHPGNEDVPTGK